MGKTMRAIGLMSGTSMDGIDVALIETDGDHQVRRGPAGSFPYSDPFRAQLRLALGEAAGLRTRHERPGSLRLTEQYLTDLHAEAIGHFLQDHQVTPGSVELVGFHGHTLLHAPERRLTVQIGNGPGLAQSIGIDVVYDLRAADVAAGGQGAPLAPVYHRALAAKLPDKPVAVVNIGGVANVTWIGRDGTLLAFDTGPGNALIDDWLQHHAGQSFDDGGAMAASGRIDDAALTALMTNGYFGRPPPKSLDRNAFNAEPAGRLSVADGAATLTAFTAVTVARAREHFPEQPRLWVISGGGRRNKTLMSLIAAEVESAVAPAEAAGFDGDAVEAEAWAYMAVRSLHGLPITFPGTTGVAEPLTGGVLARKG